jgi:hypothetical protein
VSAHLAPTGDACFLARSLLAVAISPPMPRWRDYRSLVEQQRAALSELDRDRESEGPLVPPLAARLSRCDWPALPPLSRIIGALVSFADDHDAPLPREMFPCAATLDFLARLAGASARSLDRERQLERALALEGDPWRALLVCHLATRLLARGRDRRALGRDAHLVPSILERRFALGAPIAPFPSSLSRGGDPLGDTYHYWANVIAGVASVRASRRLCGRSLAALFHAGPWLMVAVRERLFGSPLFYGAHAAIDRLGLAHGIALGSRRSSGVYRGL